jgi:hypothetical protein
MTWSTDRAPLDPRRSYRVGVFDGPFQDASQRRARFRPSGPTAVPTGPRPSLWFGASSAGRP